MDIASPCSHVVDRVAFAPLSANDAINLSTAALSNPILFDAFSRPQPKGLYDPAMGPVDKASVCTTCRLPYFQCPGHWGHIKLHSVLFNPVLFPNAYKLLQSLCYYCHRLRIPRVMVAHFSAKFRLIYAGLILEAERLDSYITTKGVLRISSTANVGADEKDGLNVYGVDEDVMEPEEQGLDHEGRLLFHIQKYLDKCFAASPKDDDGNFVFSQSKSTLITSQIRALEKQFLASITPGPCPSCKGISPKFRKEGQTKIFEREIHAKNRALNSSRALVPESIVKEMYDDIETVSTPVKVKKEACVDVKGMGKDKDANAVGPTLSSADSVASSSDDEDSMAVSASTESMDNTVTSKTAIPSPTQLLPAKMSDTVPIVNSVTVNKDTLLLPIQILGHLRKLWSRESEILNLVYGSVSFKGSATSPLDTPDDSHMERKSDPAMFFLNILPVTPSKFRPPSKMNDMVYEHPQNAYLTAILKVNQSIADLQTQQSELPSNAKEEIAHVTSKLVNAVIALQDAVNNLIDSSKAPLVQGKPPQAGIRQLLEKKEGLFRKHMMGKRVNFAARSVISPDVNLETGEIGIPPVFAKKLTYPAPVTPFNSATLREMVINGPHEWPGATHVQNEDGSMINLALLDHEGRVAVGNSLCTPGKALDGTATHTPKKVLRHLLNGDFLLLNRQPTLHKPSIMAHTARILPGEKTIRMHYANCNTYNADFDGDEMNVHFPQNDIARAEAMEIMRTEKQYLVPTDGGVLRGLIQDHVVAGVHMTRRDCFLTKEQVMQLVYAALRPDGGLGIGLGDGNVEDEIEIGLNGRVLMIEPTILKPFPMWTGKQVITTILLNLTARFDQLNLHSKSRVAAKYWGPSAPEEQTVIIMDGHLLTGVLDKAQFGATAYGIVHAVFEVYGPPFAGKLLSIFGRLFTGFLQMIGFTCRMDDLRLTPHGDSVRRKILEEAKLKGNEVALDYVGLSKDSSRIHPHKPESWYKRQLKQKLSSVIRSDERMAGWDAAMKGKMNAITSQIIGGCIPENLLRTFPENNMQAMTVSGAKGSNVNVSQISCLLGQQELEGRRVPTMVSGKTLPSFLPFDSSARAGGYIAGRFLTGIKPQEYFFHCMAGREGLIDTAVKTSRSGYLQRCLIKHLEGIRVQYDHTVRDEDGSVLQFHYGEDSLDVTRQKYLFKFDFSAMNFQAMVNKYKPSEILSAGTVDLDTATKAFKKACKKGLETVDPMLNSYSPGKYLGSVSERFTKLMDEYIAQNSDGLIVSKSDKASDKPSITSKKFKSLMHLKYMRCLVDAGEAVGLLAAQSIGEPSTQMTLNTFHFAGFGAKNVTLGIPRLREIIMTASANIKTPMMTLPMRSHVSELSTKNLAKRMSRLVLSHIVESLQVQETLTSKGSTGGRVKKFTIRINFWDKQDYLEEYGLAPKDIEQVLELRFVQILDTLLRKELRQKAVKEVEEDERIGEALGTFDAPPAASASAQDGDTAQRKSGDDSDDEDGDATAASRANKKKQHASYDAPDSDDEAIIKQANQLDDAEETPTIKENHEDSERDSEGQARSDRIADLSRFVTQYRFDKKHGKWCELELQLAAQTKKILMLPLVERVCQSVVIHEVKGLARAFLMQNETENDKILKIATEGVNLAGMWDMEAQIDINKIYTNDVAAVLKTYGVEAARAAIMREIAGVFGVYGISVDTRHLSLIADYMTFEGAYKPFNRMGMGSNPSPFAQMSFETTTNFLKTAVLSGDYDDLQSPSARLVMGQVVRGGTGSFEVIQPLDLKVTTTPMEYSAAEGVSVGAA